MNFSRLIRSHYEESPGFDGVSENHHISLPSNGIFVVADGLGGPVAGKEAARVACEAVVEFLKREGGDRDATLPFVLRSYCSLPGNVLFNALIHANRRVLALNQGKGVHEKGAASVIAGLVDRQTLALASIGGNSAWLTRGGEVRELVTPRSWGRFRDPRGAAPEPWVDALPLAALGVVEDLEPEVVEFRLREGDRIHAGCNKAFSNQIDSTQAKSAEQLQLVWEVQ